MFACADANLNTLLAFRYKRRFDAGTGGHGKSALKHGANGRDVVIGVPLGTQVRSVNGEGTVLADLLVVGQRVLVAKGGRGGRGNAAFASSTNRFPLLAEEGEAGEAVTVRLEMKLLADVGIVGAPNAGKSSLLAAVTAARPKIGSYPFTTTEAELGVVERRDESFVLVDIPGLIEGAHQGVGMGDDFLRHVERTRVVIHMVDGSLADVEAELEAVETEMRLFGGGLEDKPQVVAVNKIDMPEVRDRVADLEVALGDSETPVYFISAVTGEGLGELMDRVIALLARERETRVVVSGAERSPGAPVLRPRPRDEKVRVNGGEGVFEVSLPAAARIAAMIDLDNWAARMQFHRELNRMGVIRALEEAGVASGDTVRIGKVEWEWD